ncbi:unnamed protein product [Heligmosomoides polygyrus]|uniref:Peptidase M13 N-terminal domain-containing protein n=1 Tax=Heligmosomoides polygyrus TaxID=6339 RepID=A0A3P8FV61_HELPZ|nr:unnamed protein product [Heligmosomoides polygyrus]
MLLIIHICSGNVKFDDPCHYNFTVINQRYNISSKPEKAQNLSDILRLTIDYKVDPCDNFYNFACGTWIKNIVDEPEPWNRITTLGKMKAYYLNELKGIV